MCACTGGDRWNLLTKELVDFLYCFAEFNSYKATRTKGMTAAGTSIHYE